MMNANRRIASVLLFLVLSAIDVAFNAAAGPAAVAAGAHVNGSALTDRALGIGALSAATKSGLLAFVAFLGFANMNIAASLLLILVATGFGICVLITAQVSSIVLDDTPDQLLKAALVAALPLQWEFVAVYYSVSAYRSQDQFSGEVTNTFNPSSVIGSWIANVGWDALGGYTFARMAQNLGYPICELGAAAAAGGVYGVLSGIPKIIAYIAWGVMYQGM